MDSKSSETSEIPGVYRYEHLPELAKRILENHLVTFCNEQLTYARHYKLPLLDFLVHFSDAELIEISKKSVSELLEYLTANNAREQIIDAAEKWMTNQLEIIGKYDIVAEDITLISHLRGKSLKNFAFKLYRDNDKLQALLQEIDDFLLGSTTISANTYINILKDKIKQEVDYNARLSDALPGFIYVYDVKQKQLVHSNEKMHELLGYDKALLQEISQDFYQSIIHPHDYENLVNCRQDYVANKPAICSFECRLKNLDGKYTWLRFYETNLRVGSAGESAEIIGVAFDISHEKKITEALALSEKQLLEAQRIAHIGSYEWDVKGLKTTISTPEIHKIFEMDELEEFHEFMKYVHADDVQGVHDAIALSLETGYYQCVYRFIKNNKEKILWSQGVVSFDNGEPTVIVGTVQDVTLIKRMEAELREKATELERSNERLQDFAAVASHDLKEPLRKISLYSSKVLYAEKQQLSEATDNAINKILENALRMQKMIEEILDFSFITSGQEKTATDLDGLVTEVKELLSESIEEKQAQVTTDHLPVAVVVASQMKQVFQNLISNALKFSRVGVPPRIHISHEVRTLRKGSSTIVKDLIIRIEDNGIGFQEKYQEKIFGAFHRLHNKAAFEGSGLGLSICQRIMANHGGRISARSVPDVGSVFTLEFPMEG